ncbi:MAG: ROK family protein [Gaiellaceae bacterium]
MLHPEFGHMRVPHDRARDPFAAVGPNHGDCFEGLASGDAVRARWGHPPEELTDERVWLLEAEYLALGLLNVICTLSPQRIILGGGVLKEPLLLPAVRSRVSELAGDYFAAPGTRGGNRRLHRVPPALGDRAGVVGALELARLAVGGVEA